MDGIRDAACNFLETFGALPYPALTRRAGAQSIRMLAVKQLRAAH